MAVDVAVDGRVATVTLNRPDALNAFNTEQLVELRTALATVAQQRGIRCLIITGAGTKAFAAGADIKEMTVKSPEEGLAFARLGHAVMRAIENLPMPVIAAVNGFALGGGCELALACDIRLASDAAVFAQPEVGLGIPPTWGGTQRLPRIVGPGLAAEMIFSGRRVGAEEALRTGLVNAVHPSADLLGKARELADLISRNSPNAVAVAKQLLQLAGSATIVDGLDTEARLAGECFGTIEQREGMAAFVEKRRPDFANPG